MATERRGAYGLVPATPLSLSDDLAVAPGSWVDWRFESRVGDPLGEMSKFAEDERYFLSESRARLPLLPTGFVTIDRANSTSSFVLDHELTAPELLHPAMASTAATVAWWSGRLALHGAAAARDDTGAIGFLGDREHGKSTSITWLREQGWYAMSDDVLVMDGQCLLAGPRIVDLRPTTAARWQLGTNVGRLGQRERWRIDGLPAPAEAPMRALVTLAWGESVDVTPVPFTQRFGVLAEHNVLQEHALDQRRFLALLGVPMFRFTRPYDLAGMDEAMGRLLETVLG